MTTADPFTAREKDVVRRLKDAFPDVTFDVQPFMSYPAAVWVWWKDGPTRRDVLAVLPRVLNDQLVRATSFAAIVAFAVDKWVAGDTTDATSEQLDAFDALELSCEATRLVEVLTPVLRPLEGAPHLPEFYVDADRVPAAQWAQGAVSTYAPAAAAAAGIDARALMRS